MTQSMSKIWMRWYFSVHTQEKQHRCWDEAASLLRWSRAGSLQRHGVMTHSEAAFQPHIFRCVMTAMKFVWHLHFYDYYYSKINKSKFTVACCLSSAHSRSLVTSLSPKFTILFCLLSYPQVVIVVTFDHFLFSKAQISTAAAAKTVCDCKRFPL